MDVQSRDHGTPVVHPYLMVADVERQVAFLQQVFGADDLGGVRHTDGTRHHAEVRIGSTVLMLGRASADWPVFPTSAYVMVDDVDATVRRALDAGAHLVLAVADRYYGHREGGVEDASGNRWWIATRVADVASEDLDRLAAAALAAGVPKPEASGGSGTSRL